MRHLSMKEWGEYQHYKDRHPPWIKLHAKILSNYAYRCLRDASKSHLTGLWVLASKFDNRIPYDLAFITQMIGATEPIDIEELVLQGFVEVSQDDGRALPPRSQDASKLSAPKTEVEKEKKPSNPERYAFMGELRPVWKEAYGGELPKGSAKELEGLVKEHGLAKVVANLRNYVKANPAPYGTIPKFGSTFGTWDTAKTNGVLQLDADQRREKLFKQRGWA